jgi:hypothetical protein
MRRSFVVLVGSILLVLGSTPAQQPPPATQAIAKTMMTADEFKAAGLQKLTPSELEALDRWLLAYTVTVLQFAQQNANQLPGSPPVATPPTARGYVVEASVNDDTFIINGEVFKAKTYCFNVQKGDRVIFTEGSALGACATAEFVVLRTSQKCSVWCE